MYQPVPSKLIYPEAIALMVPCNPLVSASR